MAVGRSSCLAVAGMLGAGKTTLVTALCRHLGWERCPPRSPDPEYVERIHRDPARWSFEAQLNFLVLKASGLRVANEASRPVVVDRSIYEDRDIMARSWAEIYWDVQARRTYEDSARLLCADLPTPVALIYCRCSREVCEERRRSRPRPYERFYDPRWVSQLDELYAEWLTSFDECPLLEFDTETYDSHDARVVADVLADLRMYFAPAPANQTVLFDTAGQPQATPLFAPQDRTDLRILRPLNTVAPTTSADFAPTGAVRLFDRAPRHPAVFIAAPFTDLAVTPEALVEDLRLDLDGRRYGVIPAAYREILEAIAAGFEARGVAAVLPHRDVNAWGNKPLRAAEVVAACVRLVRDCELFVGVLGRSFGAHTEAGAAIAAGKPCVFVEVAELGESFTAQGLGELPGAILIRVPILADVVAALNGMDIDSLLARAR